MVIDLFYPSHGGGETVALEYAKRLVKIGIDIHVLTSRIQGTLKYEVIEGIKVHRVFGTVKSLKFLENTMANVSFVSPGVEIVKKYKIDLIHGFSYNGIFPSYWIGKFTNRPVIAHIHELFGDFWDNITRFPMPSFYRTLEKNFVFLDYHHCISVSKFTKKDIKKYGVKSGVISVVPNAVDHSRFYSNHHSDKFFEIVNKESVYSPASYENFILNVSKFRLHKGQDLLIEMMRDFVKKHRRTLLILVGSGLKEKYLRSLIEKYELQENVLILKDISDEDLKEVYAGADVFVNLSLREGFYLCGLEAWASHLPVISTPVGIFAYDLLNLRNGMKIELDKDILFNTKKALVRLFEDKKLREFIAERGYRTSKMYSWENSVDELLSVYDLVLDRGS